MKIIALDSSNESQQFRSFIEAARAHYPEVELLPVSGNQSIRATDVTLDSVLVIFFTQGDLSGAHTESVSIYRNATKSAERFILVSCGETPYLNGELSGFKAIPSQDYNSDGNILRRLGAYLGVSVIPKENEIFISYRVTDGAKISSEVSKYLQSQNFKVWRDEDRDEDNEGNLTCGVDVQTEILSAIKSSNLVILIE